ncbi:MAG: PfkB family carbohydrate kinase [Actinomycetota bacterium]|nr:PfkB family carbohydrate kinase [Actinomycetota bacterium]
MSAPRGLFVGLTTLDLVQRVERAPGANDKVRASRADLASGGPAANAAVTFGALGGRATLVSALGPGPVARLAADDLSRHGVTVADCWPSGGPDLSISAATVLEGTGERSVVSHNAADVEAVVPPDLDGLVADADVVLIDGHHPELALAAARCGQQAGVAVVLDCGSEKEVFADLTPLAAAAVCSAEFTVAGAGGFDEVSAALLDAGTGLVVMTDGAQPVRWRTRHAAGTIEVPPTTARDTLGAGDVLHGAFARAWAAGVRDPERSLRFATAVATVRVEHVGPRSWLSDPRLSQLAQDELR